nr:hypothetical protein BHI3_03830 [Bacteriovorax sp. HI3]
MSLLKQSLHLVAAVVVVTIQIIAQPIFFGVFGSTTAVESMILIAVMGGICLGQSGLLNIAWTRILLTVSGIILTLLGWFYSEAILQGSRSLIGELLAGFFIVLTVVSSGILSSRAIYLDSDIKKNYFWHNLICAFGILCLFGIQVKFGNAAVCIVAGSALLLISLSHRLWNKSESLLAIHWNSLTLTSLGLGFFSGVYLSCVLETMELSIFPSGFEFHFYLLLTFLHLAVARYLPARKVKFSLIPIMAFLALILILVGFFGGVKDFFFFNQAPLIFSSYSVSYRIALVSFIQVFTLLIPYAFFAYVVPRRQLETPNENHLFFVSLGNFLGFLIPGVLLIHPPLEMLLPLFFILSLVWWKTVDFNNKKQMVGLAVCAVILCVFLFPNPSRRILVQSLKSRILLTESVFVDKSFGLNGVQEIHRKEGKVGFVYSYGDIPGIGLGGYVAPMYSPADLAKSLATKRLMKENKVKRVLILGLGNHLLLKYASILQDETGGTIETIDVIDNFPPYEREGFRKEISDVIDFNDKKLPTLKVHTDDVFKFLARKKYNEAYDLIVNNLTWPLYMSARLTYTKEFFDLVNGALTDNGIFVTRSFTDERINCLTNFAFPFTGRIRQAGLAPVIVGSRTAVTSAEAFSDQGKCDEGQNPNLSKLFWGQGLYERNMQKRSSIRSIAESRVLFYPATGVLKEKAEVIGKASSLFSEKYHKEIISVDSNSSDIFAQYLYKAFSLNSRHRQSFSIWPYLSKDIELSGNLSKLKPTCSFYKDYKKKFTSSPDVLGVRVYSELLKSYNISEDCFETL